MIRLAMKPPGPRLTIRAMIVLVVVIAIALKWAIDRPYPYLIVASATWYVAWSDGSVTTESGQGRYDEQGTSWCKFVRWPDGRTSFYLTVRPFKFEGTPQ